MLAKYELSVSNIYQVAITTYRVVNDHGDVFVSSPRTTRDRDDLLEVGLSPSLDLAFLDEMDPNIGTTLLCFPTTVLKQLSIPIF